MPKELRPEEFDNARPPSRQTEIPVFALALVLGTAPEREWLVYAHAPRQARPGVTITLPGFGAITADVPQSGSFYHVQEKGKQVRPVLQGGPASLRVEAPRSVAVGAPASFTARDKYSPTGSIALVQWDFGDGERANGDRVVRRFAKPGQYLVAATGSQEGKEVVHEQVPVFVGFEPEEGVVCRLLMKGALRDGMKSWVWLGGWDKVEYHFIPDASGAGNLGFLAGGAWVRDDRRGTVLELDGKSDRVEIGNSPEINTGGAHRQRSIAFWFRTPGGGPLAAPEAEKGRKLRQVLYEEGGPGSGINLYLDGGVLYAGAWNEGKGTWLNGKEVERGVWHHVALVLGAAAAKGPEVPLELYLDGREVAGGNAPVPGEHPGDITIGRCGNTLFHDHRAVEQPAHGFAGRIDDFRIANRSWTAEEVRALSKAR
jgi:hypothetical protein